MKKKKKKDYAVESSLCDHLCIKIEARNLSLVLCEKKSMTGPPSFNRVPHNMAHAPTKRKRPLAEKGYQQVLRDSSVLCLRTGVMKGR